MSPQILGYVHRASYHAQQTITIRNLAPHLIPMGMWTLPTSDITSNPFLPCLHWKTPHQASWAAASDEKHWVRHRLRYWPGPLFFLMDHILALFSHLIPFQITIYDQENFQGKRMEFTSSCPNVSERNFDNVRSLKVECGAWVSTSAESQASYFWSLQTCNHKDGDQRIKIFPQTLIISEREASIPK